MLQVHYAVQAAAAFDPCPIPPVNCHRFEQLCTTLGRHQRQHPCNCTAVSTANASVPKRRRDQFRACFRQGLAATPHQLVSPSCRKPTSITYLPTPYQCRSTHSSSSPSTSLGPPPQTAFPVPTQPQSAKSQVSHTCVGWVSHDVWGSTLKNSSLKLGNSSADSKLHAVVLCMLQNMAHARQTFDDNNSARFLLSEYPKSTDRGLPSVKTSRKSHLCIAGRELFETGKNSPKMSKSCHDFAFSRAKFLEAKCKVS